MIAVYYLSSSAGLNWYFICHPLLMVITLVSSNPPGVSHIRVIVHDFKYMDLFCELSYCLQYSPYIAMVPAHQVYTLSPGTKISFLLAGE